MLLVLLIIIGIIVGVAMAVIEHRHTPRIQDPRSLPGR